MIQINLEFSSRESTKTTQAAEHKRKQIKKLLSLLCSKQKSLQTTLTSFTHLVGDPVCSGNKGNNRKTLYQHQTHLIQHLMNHQLMNK